MPTTIDAPLAVSTVSGDSYPQIGLETPVLSTESAPRQRAVSGVSCANTGREYVNCMSVSSSINADLEFAYTVTSVV